nr:uncharacterized protein LOC116148941 [Camelus dromedarius]
MRRLPCRDEGDTGGVSAGPNTHPTPPRFQAQEVTKVSTSPRMTPKRCSPQAPRPPGCPPRVQPMNSAPLLRRPLGGTGPVLASSVPARNASPPSPESYSPRTASRGKGEGARQPKRICGRDRKGVDRRPHSRGRTARGVHTSPTLSSAGAKEPAPQCSGLRALQAEAAGDRGCQGAPGRGSQRAPRTSCGRRKPAGGAPVGAAPAPRSAAANAPQPPGSRVAGCGRHVAAREARVIQPPTCSAEGKHPSKYRQI